MSQPTAKPIVKANNRKVVHIPSLTNEDGTPYPITIRKISTKTVGMNASMTVLERNALVREGALNAKEGGEQATAFTSEQPRPPTVSRYSEGHHEYRDSDDPRLKLDILRESERAILRAGLVEPTFTELCEMFDADPEYPEQDMGEDFDVLVQAIGEFSGIGQTNVGGVPMTAEQAERFPDEIRGADRRNSRKVRKNAR